MPTAGAIWFAAGGHGDLSADETSDIPAYMNQSSQLGPEHGVLIVRGDVETGLRYVVRRGDGDTVGDDEILALTDEDVAFTENLRDLVARPTPEAVDELAARGIEYVVLPAPADGRVAAAARRLRRPGPGERGGPVDARLAGRRPARRGRPRRPDVVAARRAARDPGARDRRRAGAGRAVGPAATPRRSRPRSGR